MMCESKKFIFIDYFLEKRLKRVPTEILMKFLRDYKEITKSTSQAAIVDEIVSYYKIMKDNEKFILHFYEFIRDYVLSARESNYLIRVESKDSVVSWIKSWTDNVFYGQHYDFYLHFYEKLEEKFI